MKREFTNLVAQSLRRTRVRRPLVLLEKGLLRRHDREHACSHNDRGQRCFDQGEATRARRGDCGVVTVMSEHRYFPETRLDILKIGRMMAMAMKPTTEPMSTIMMGSIMLVTVLIASLSALA